MKGFNSGQSLKKLNEANGFTMVELLVVIAVIAILASLLLPSLLGARQTAQSTFCKNNLRQMSLALQLYADDYAAYPYFAANYKTWWESLGPYFVKQWHSAAYLCPTYTYKVRNDAPRANGYVYASTQVGYGINYNGLGITGQAGPPVTQRRLGACSHYGYPLVRESDVRMPFEMIAFGDSFVADGYKVSRGFGIVDINFPAASLVDEPQIANKRHRGRLNVSFCDAHVASIPYRKLLLDRSEDSLRRWNNDHLPHTELLHH